MRVERDIEGGRRLAAAIDATRCELGLSKRDLARLARVGRSTVADLINQAKVPGRAVTLQRIEAALGWQPGSCDAVMAGGEPTVRAGSPALSGKAGPGQSVAGTVLAEQLQSLAEQAKADAVHTEALAARLHLLSEQAASAARLVLRHRD